jgi:hypothetical protein
MVEWILNIHVCPRLSNTMKISKQNDEKPFTPIGVDSLNQPVNNTRATTNLAFSSPELKAQVSFSKYPLFVCLPRFTKFLLLQNQWANFIYIFHKIFSDKGDSSLFK